MRSDRRLSIRETTHELNLSFYVVRLIVIEDLKMCRVSVKFVPILLSDEQKEYRLQVSQKLLNLTDNNSDLLNRVNTGVMI